jgi:hypothetical protein
MLWAIDNRKDGRAGGLHPCLDLPKLETPDILRRKDGIIGWRRWWCFFDGWRRVELHPTLHPGLLNNRDRNFFSLYNTKVTQQ